MADIKGKRKKVIAEKSPLKFIVTSIIIVKTTVTIIADSTFMKISRFKLKFVFLNLKSHMYTELHMTIPIAVKVAGITPGRALAKAGEAEQDKIMVSIAT